MADTIRMYSGDAKVFTVTITDEADAPVDCSTATAIVGTCRSAVGGSSTFAISLADGDISVGGAGKNVLTCTIPPEDTASVTAAQSGTTYYMDIEVTWSAANVQSFPRDASGDPSLLTLIIYGDMTT
jgi:hypothetical protein